jgi:hypothetical protein
MRAQDTPFPNRSAPIAMDTDQIIALRAKIRRMLLGVFSPKTLDSERRRAELNAALQPHWAEDNIEVYELIREDWEDTQIDPTAKARNMIVFIDQDMDVDWIAEVPPKAARCVSLAESIAAQKCDHLGRGHLLHFRRLIGQSIVIAIKGDVEQGCLLARQAARFLEDRTIELSRRWILFDAHVLVIGLSLALAALAGCLFEYLFINHQRSTFAWLAIQGGLVGAYLSIVQNAGNGHRDASAGPEAHLLEVFTKLSVGAVLGGCAFAITHSVHAPPSLKLITPDGYSTFLLGVAAGLGERLVPKIISEYGARIHLNKDHETKSGSD